ncbi:YopX family protein [Carnobacterium divergens]|uniref:YopX family protein n=1 Tax=Carnobacterium divergens TaxID=2748 RepID=UPI002890D07D|nr:YopX family protein [Carnobacterium divergens]MDT2011138.1 YopX family protein [Carnobacterium divergens]
MREIKFRGKAIDTEEWVYGVPIPNGFGTRVFMITLILGDDVAYPIEKLHEFCREVIPETVSQYTGIDDKNREDIFDKDFIDDGKEIWKVEYSKTECGFNAIGVSNHGIWSLYHLANGHNKGREIEVIGNKFDNPELLEG